MADQTDCAEIPPVPAPWPEGEERHHRDGKQTTRSLNHDRGKRTREGQPQMAASADYEITASGVRVNPTEPETSVVVRSVVGTLS